MTLKLISAAILAGLVALATPAAAGTYDFDIKGQHAFIDFRIKHLGYSWLLGRFDKFNGAFDFDEKNADASKVKVEIDMASINSNHAERDKHLRGPDFLDVAKFPTATFESTSVKSDGNKAAITGKLTLHGVTKDVTINAEKVGNGPDPWGPKGGVRQGFTGTAKLTLADFGITKDLGPASKDVELTLNVEGVKKP